MPEDELFGRLTVEIHCHISYLAHYGWSVRINSRLEGNAWSSDDCDVYGPMTLEELPTVVDAAVTARYLGTRYQV